jgi:hypothetical protein
MTRDLTKLTNEELAVVVDGLSAHGLFVPLRAELARRLRADDFALAAKDARIRELEAEVDERHAKLVMVADKLQAAKQELAANSKGEAPIAVALDDEYEVGDKVKHRLASGWVDSVVVEVDHGDPDLRYAVAVRDEHGALGRSVWSTRYQLTRLPPEPATPAPSEAVADGRVGRRYGAHGLSLDGCTCVLTDQTIMDLAFHLRDVLAGVAEIAARFECHAKELRSEPSTYASRSMADYDDALAAELRRLL